MPPRSSSGRSRSRSRSTARKPRVQPAATGQVNLPASPTAGPPRSPSPVAKKLHTHVVAIHHVPEHLQFNRFIHSGYRKHPLTVAEAMWSWLQVHNETANIYTHLFGALVCYWWAATAAVLPHASSGAWLHYRVVQFADLCSALCFTASVIYHTGMNTARDVAAYKQLMLFDVYGIWVVNMGAAAASAYMLLPCASWLVKALLIAAPVAGSLWWIVFMATTPASRAKAFGITWLMRIGTIVGTAALGVTHWPVSWLLLHFLSELWPAAGAVINVLRIPEKWHPGRFDLVFNSHNIMVSFPRRMLVARHCRICNTPTLTRSVALSPCFHSCSTCAWR